MADDDTDTGGTGDPPAKDRKKQIKNEHVLIVVGVLGLLITLLYLRKSAAANQAATNTNSNPYGYNQYPQTTSGYDPSGMSYGSAYNEGILAQDIQQLQNEVTTMQAANPATGTPTAPGATPVVSPTAGTYGWQPISQNVAATVQGLLNSGQAVGYSPDSNPADILPVSQPQAGGQWLFGGSPNAPGNPAGPAGAPSRYYAKVA